MIAEAGNARHPQGALIEVPGAATNDGTLALRGSTCADMAVSGATLAIGGTLSNLGSAGIGGGSHGGAAPGCSVATC